MTFMLKEAVDWFCYSLLGLNPSSVLSQSINYFIYDSIKILLLLFFMIAIIGFLRTYIPRKKAKEFLTKRKFLGHVFASLFGVITPFCSCSSIPIFLGFLEAGIPLGVSFSFLITSPLVNEYLVVLMLGFFGIKITAAYVLSGIVIGVIAGIILGRMKLEKHLVKDFAKDAEDLQKDSNFKGIKERMLFGILEAVSMVRKLWLWVLFGVALGAFIHNYIPEGTIQSFVNAGGIFSVPLAVLIGVPIYGSCAAILPIAVALFQKGLPLGTALAFMMAVSALSLPEAVILRRAMKLRLILIFFGTVALALVFTGYLFNFLQPLLA